MDIKFEIGKVNIPFPGGHPIELEGLKFIAKDVDTSQLAELLKASPQTTQQKEEENYMDNLMHSLHAAQNFANASDFLNKHEEPEYPVPNFFDGLAEDGESPFPNLEELMKQHGEEAPELPEGLKKLFQAHPGGIPIAIKVPKGVSLSDVLQHLKNIED